MAKDNFRIDVLLFGFLLTLTSSFGQTFFIALFSQPIRDSLSLTNFEFSSVYSIATLLSAACLSWSGQAIDTMRLEKIVGIALLGLLIGAIAFSFAQIHIAILFFALFCLRQFGQGLLSLISAATITRSFQGARGRALSISTLGHPFGEAVLPSVAIALLVSYGHKHAWLLFAGCITVITLLLIVTAKRISIGDTVEETMSSPATVLPTEQRQWTRREVLRDRYFWILLPMLLTAPFVITALFFHQVAIVESKQWPLTEFAASFGIYALAQVMGSLGAGYLIDRWNARRLLRFTVIPLILACYLLAIGDTTIYLWAFMGFSGLSTGSMFPSTVAALSEIYGVKYIGSIKAVVASALVFSTALSPPIVGWFLDHNVGVHEISLGLCLTGILCFIGGNISLLIIDRRQNIEIN